MDNKIKQILETDRVAREKIAQAKEDAALRRKELDGKISGIRNTYEERAKAEVEIASRVEDKKIEHAVKKQREKNEAILKAMEEKYHANKEQWIEKLFERVISG